MNHEPLTKEQTADLQERLDDLLNDHYITAKQQAAIIMQCDLAYLSEYSKHKEAIAAMVKINEMRQEEIEEITRKLITDDSKKRSIKTPIGSVVKLTQTEGSIEPIDGEEDRSVRLIMSEADQVLDPDKYPNPIGEFLNIKRTLNKAALRQLPPQVLAAFNLRFEGAGDSFKLSHPKEISVKAPEKKKQAS